MNTGISADQLEVILQEADWMMQMVQPDGAFANYPDMQQIRPYMALYGPFWRHWLCARQRSVRQHGVCRCRVALGPLVRL